MVGAWLIRSCVGVAFFLALAVQLQAQVTVVWANRYDDPLRHDNFPAQLAVDPFGDIIVTGYSHDGSTPSGTLKYRSSDGALLWSNIHSGFSARHLAVDAAGNAYVFGGYYARLHKYDPTGNLLWQANPFDVGAGVAVDPDGNVVVTLSAQLNGQGAYDIVTIKYNSEGTSLWERRFGEPGDANEEARHVATDAAGNIYVTGYAVRPERFTDFVTLKYDPLGSLVWSNYYGGPTNFNDTATALAVDPAGSVYVTGRSGNQESADIVTVKYDVNGNEAWAARETGEDFHTYASGIALDSLGNPIVIGYVEADFYHNFITTKYSAAGQRLWSRRHGGLALDGADHIYVAGDSGAVRYDGNGNRQWVVGGVAGGFSNITYAAIAVDQFADVYLAGWFYGPPFNADYATVKLTQNVEGLPQILTQPQPATVLEGTNVSFSATAMGTPPLYYQWYFNGTPLRRATNNVLEIPVVNVTNAGIYSVTVSNAVGAVLPPEVRLRVLRVARRFLSDRSAFAGTTFRWSAFVTGDLPISYQWRFEGVTIPNATTNFLILTNVQLAQAGVYTLIASNAHGVNAAAATLRVSDQVQEVWNRRYQAQSPRGSGSCERIGTGIFTWPGLI